MNEELKEMDEVVIVKPGHCFNKRDGVIVDITDADILRVKPVGSNYVVPLERDEVVPWGTMHGEKEQ